MPQEEFQECSRRDMRLTAFFARALPRLFEARFFLAIFHHPPNYSTTTCKADPRALACYPLTG